MEKQGQVLQSRTGGEGGRCGKSSSLRLFHPAAILLLPGLSAHLLAATHQQKILEELKALGFGSPRRAANSFDTTVRYLIVSGLNKELLKQQNFMAEADPLRRRRRKCL